ncbi:MAG: tetratricopeptide repeat protein [Rhodospirillales bacterium]|nr:tetratricopeptide repeat protein [Rhodospirillales bacterium]MBO6788089.1 tetratricopeptide repeat protein [Rhodospirillales bacterium]
MARIFLGLLGGFRARQTGGDELLFPTRKSRMLCAYLAMPVGEPRPRERLAGLLWSERADEQARGSLRNALTTVRRVLGADAIRVESDQVALVPSVVSCDVDRFMVATAQGTAESLRQAYEIYRGPLLDGLPEGEEPFDDWLRNERARIDKVAHQALSSLLDSHVVAGEAAAGLDVGNRLISIDPLHEATYRTVMELHTEIGERAQALRIYEDLRRLLANEVGVEPDADTRALADEIRTHAKKPASAPKRVAPADTAGPEKVSATPIDRPSIAVLPFASLGGDDEAFADGIVEEITAALSRVRSFFVIARNSAVTFKDTDLPTSKIAERLGVRYLLTGSVRRGAGRLRIATQLIEADTADHLWSERFEGGDQDIFDLQDRITEEVVGILQPTILAAEVGRARRKRPDNLQAYDIVHRAFPHIWAMTEEDNKTALEMLRKAIALDPNYALAYALISWCHAQNITYNWTGDIVTAKERALERAHEAFRLDLSDPMVLAMLATAESLVRDHDSARVHIDRALRIDPNSAWAWMRSGWIHCYQGNFETSIEHFERAWRLSPYDPLNFNLCFGIGLSHFALGHDEKAASLIERGLLENPDAVWANRPLVAVYAWLDRMDDAKAATERVLARYPDVTVSKIMDSIPHQAPVMVERYTKGLVMGGFPQ